MTNKELLPNGNVRVSIPITFRKVKQAKILVFPEKESEIQLQTPLITAIANGLLWQQMLDDRVVQNVEGLSRHIGKDRAYISHVLKLALLSPGIVHLAIMGRMPDKVTYKSFRKGMPADWDEQKKMLGIE